MLDFQLALSQPEAHPSEGVYDLIVLGGGPAGLTAAIYAGRARIQTLVILGPLPGGQPANTEEVENFPGFPEGIGGADLARRFLAQAERFGARLIPASVTGVDLSIRPFIIRTDGATYRAHTLVIAMGAVPRRLGVPGEDRFFGRGVSTCATCDGFFYRDKRVVVVGGGDSAIIEGLYLTRFAREVIVVHRRDQLRATRIYQERAFANPRMRFLWDSVVEEILGEQTVTGVRVRHLKTGETSIIEADGVFVYIGMEPQTQLFVGQLELDEHGYIITDRRQRTSVPGVFAAGDIQDPFYRQLVVAASTGAIAAMEVEKYLELYPQSPQGSDRW
ncbi:MAG: thioredoxin-disulfide reductase [Anaerolineae bacterium]|nr:thioredoxin-disulfide reductase [Anaerolineae bacterium]MDW8067689.1 thioredoxin-disulfide reductase [Anaerolineae bacterium]